MTDKFAKWVNPTKSTRPIKAIDLDVRPDPSKPSQPKPNTQNYKPVYDVNDSKSTEKMVYRLMKDQKLEACAAYILSDSSDESEYEFESFYQNVVDIAKQFSARDPDCQNFEEFVGNVGTYYSNEVCSEIFDSTTSQSQSNMWFYQRVGRITASNVHACLHYTGRSEEGSLIKTILGKTFYDTSSVPSLNHGRKYESKARELYLEQFKNEHQEVEFESTGLIIVQSEPLLGASPDGFVKCKCCGKGCIEIKCPYTNANLCPKQAAGLDLKNFCMQSELPILKKSLSSPYYCQIMCQLALSNREWCDLTLFTHKGIYTQRIVFDNEVWNTMKDQLRLFYKSYVYPKFKSLEYA